MSQGLEAQPTHFGERLQILDVLRGFALAGVFTSNAVAFFIARSYLSQGQIEAARASSSTVDSIALYVFNFLISGKALTLFSFLFGLGFALQMERAESRGSSVVPLHARRLGVLLLIGSLHFLTLWYGDITSHYAMLGFVLLLLRGRSDRALLIGSAILIFVGPLVLRRAQHLWPLLTGLSPEVAAEAARAATKRADEIRASTLEALTTGTYLDVVRAHVTYYFRVFLPRVWPSNVAILGRFMLGLLVGRHRLFHDVPRHLPVFRKMLGWGLAIGLLANGSVLAVRLMTRHKQIPVEWPGKELVMGTSQQLGELGLAAFYAAGFALLFLRPRWQRALSVLAPAGRMALTNYLTQSLINVLLFYGLGLGLMGTVGPAACIAIILGFFALQVVVSHLWLARFRFGPAEWVWRSLTYGRAQPLRVPAAPVASSTD
jgi:uncharacterized protein